MLLSHCSSCNLHLINTSPCSSWWCSHTVLPATFTLQSDIILSYNSPCHSLSGHTIWSATGHTVSPCHSLSGHTIWSVTGHTVSPCHSLCGHSVMPVIFTLPLHCTVILFSLQPLPYPTSMALYYPAYNLPLYLYHNSLHHSTCHKQVVILAYITQLSVYILSSYITVGWSDVFLYLTVSSKHY